MILFFLQCLSAEEILQIHSISSNHELSQSDFGNLSATVLYQLQNPACYSAEINTHRKVSPSAAEGKYECIRKS